MEPNEKIRTKAITKTQQGKLQILHIHALPVLLAAAHFPLVSGTGSTLCSQGSGISSTVGSALQSRLHFTAPHSWPQHLRVHNPFTCACILASKARAVAAKFCYSVLEGAWPPSWTTFTKALICRCSPLLVSFLCFRSKRLLRHFCFYKTEAYLSGGLAILNYAFKLLISEHKSCL